MVCQASVHSSSILQPMNQLIPCTASFHMHHLFHQCPLLILCPASVLPHLLSYMQSTHGSSLFNLIQPYPWLNMFNWRSPSVRNLIKQCVEHWKRAATRWTWPRCDLNMTSVWPQHDSHVTLTRPLHDSKIIFRHNRATSSWRRSREARIYTTCVTS